MVKSGRIPAPPVDDSPGSRIWYGKRLEPAIGSLCAELKNWSLRPGPYATDDQCAGMAASLDFIIDSPGPAEVALGFRGPGVLQIKNSDWFQHKRGWTGSQPPLPVILQLQHEIACSGFGWGYVVCLVGGNELEKFPYQARPRLADEIRLRVSDFWKGVRAGKPPLVDGTNSTADALAGLYPLPPNEAPIDLSGDNELPQICAGLLVATADRKGAEANERAWANRLAEKMAGHKRGACNGYLINGVLTPEMPGIRAGDLPPDKIIGARAASIWFKVIEDISK
jgi:hypothetical protein